MSDDEEDDVVDEVEEGDEGDGDENDQPTSELPRVYLPPEPEINVQY